MPVPCKYLYPLSRQPQLATGDYQQPCYDVLFFLPCILHAPACYIYLLLYRLCVRHSCTYSSMLGCTRIRDHRALSLVLDLVD